MSGAPATPPPDLDLLHRLQVEAGTATARSASPAEYASHLEERFRLWLESLLGGLGVSEAAGDGLVVVLGVVVPALLVAAVVLTLIRHRRRSPRRRPAASAPQLQPRTQAPADALEQALAAGDARTALAALWMQVEQALDAQGIGHFAPDLTEREFLATVARTHPRWDRLPELRSLSRTVVVGLYGPDGPGIDEVRALVPVARELVEPTRRVGAS